MATKIPVAQNPFKVGSLAHPASRFILLSSWIIQGNTVNPSESGDKHTDIPSVVQITGISVTLLIQSALVKAKW